MFQTGATGTTTPTDGSTTGTTTAPADGTTTVPAGATTTTTGATTPSTTTGTTVVTGSNPAGADGSTTAATDSTAGTTTILADGTTTTPAGATTTGSNPAGADGSTTAPSTTTPASTTTTTTTSPTAATGTATTGVATPAGSTAGSAVPAGTTTTTPLPASSTATAAGNIPAGSTSGTLGAVPAGSIAGSTQPVQLNAGTTAGTPPVDAAPGSDAASVTPVGTVGTQQAPIVSGSNLPPGPPMDWSTMQHDCQLVFDVEIRGAFIVPFTSPKATVIARVLRDRYLRSAQLPDISVQALNTFMYLSYDTNNNNSDLTEAQNAAAVASGATGSSGGRRLKAAASRSLLQVSRSGAELKIVVATSSVRVPSEMETFAEGVDSGSMAQDFTLAGIQTENLTLLAPPYQEELIGPGNVGQSSGGGTQPWVVGVAVGAVLLLLPVPLFLIVRWKRRKNREAREVAAAEAEAARQRMHSKMMRPGSKSFSIRPGQSADIMVRSGSAGGLAGYHNNGRLQSWSGGHERQYGQSYNPYGISRQTSATSLGSALQSARNPSYSARVPSLAGPGVTRGLPASMTQLPNGVYEDELQTARSQQGGQ